MAAGHFQFEPAPALQRKTLQAHALFAKTRQVFRFDRQPLFQLLQGKSVVAYPAQRLAGADPGTGTKCRYRCLVGQHQHVADTPLASGAADLFLPGVVGLPELTEIAHPQTLPIRFLQIGDELIDRAHLAPVPGLHGGGNHVAHMLAVGHDGLRIGTAIADPVAQLAVGIDIERLARVTAGHQHHTPRAQRMPHTQLVPHIGVVDGDVDHHQIGNQKLLKHVHPDVARAGLLVGPKRRQAGLFQCRPYQLVIDAVEIDQLPVRARFGAKRHGHEGVRLDAQ